MKKLTPSKINQIAFAARDGTADPDDVRAALLLFCQCSLEGKAIPARLISLVFSRFVDFLNLGACMRRHQVGAAGGFARWALGGDHLRNSCAALNCREHLPTGQQVHVPSPGFSHTNFRI